MATGIRLRSFRLELDSTSDKNKLHVVYEDNKPAIAQLLINQGGRDVAQRVATNVPHSIQLPVPVLSCGGG